MMYRNAKELLKLCQDKKLPISEIALMSDIREESKTAEELKVYAREIISVMTESSTYATEHSVRSISGMSGGYAKLAMDYAKTSLPLVGTDMMKAMARALSTSEVNASMGKIVAAPTAGSSGILPAVMMALKARGIPVESLVNGLFTASAIGLIVEKNANVSGAEGGCQAECGTAAAMGAAMAVELLGGTPQQALSAAGIAFMNILGLVCDPVGGFVEFPCNLRNASGVMNALASADLALAGIISPIPFDEVVETMRKVGNALPENLRETGRGGVAATPSGILLRKEYLELKKERS